MKNNNKFIRWAGGYCLWLSLLTVTTVFAAEDVEYRFERLWPRLEQSWYFSGPSDVAIASDGSVYIVDTLNFRIQQLSAQGDFIRSWGNLGAGNGQFSLPEGIAISLDGSVYIADTGNHRIQQFSAQGDFIQKWGSEGSGKGQFKKPSGIAIASDGSVYVVDKENNRIQQFSNQGGFIRTWGGLGADNGQFNNPVGIAIALNGSVYVADKDNHRIQQFNSQGDFIRTWGSLGAGNEQFNSPQGLVIASDGSIYVSERSNGRIQQFSAQGDFIRILGSDEGFGNGQLFRPNGMAITSGGNIYVADAFTNHIEQFNGYGGFIQNWGSSGIDNGQFNLPFDIASASDGSVYITDTFNNRIQQFNDQGGFIRTWGGGGVGDGEFIAPQGIAIALDDSVYIVDSRNYRIQQFSAQGNFIRTWGGEGTGNGQFNKPQGIAISSGGSVYIADTYNHRIQQFSAQGDFIRTWGEIGSGDGQFNEPVDIDIALDGSVYVADSRNNRIQQFSAQGNFIRTWGSEGIGSGQFIFPSGIGITSDGSVYVAEVVGRIQQFSAEGKFIRIWGGQGVSNGQFNFPQGITITSENSVYIADTVNNRIQKFTLKNKAITPHPYKAVILAGGGKTIAGRPNNIWASTERVTKKAYKALTRQAFKPHEEIKFLTAGNIQNDLDGNGKFDDFEAASKENLRLAITQWATDATDVVIYLANHGGPGKFQVNGNEILTAEELNTWVTQLEQLIPGKVTVIIEACNSAGFFNQLALPNRYLLASAETDQPAVISNDGLTSFSYYFWSEVATGANLGSAFETARQGMSKTLIDKHPQNAQAEADGNHIFNKQDVEALNNYCLGECNQTAAGAPSIAPITPNSRTLNGEMAQDFSIKVNHLQPLNGIWALVQRPDDISIDPNQPLNFEKINLTCNEQDVCQGRYERFDVKGEYRLNFYVRDKNEDVSFPETVVINQTQGKTVFPTEYNETLQTVYLRDVEVNGQHLQAALELQGDKFKVITYSDAPKQHSPAAQFDEASGKLTIPHALVRGQAYQATFKHVGNLAFQLESATPK